MIFLDAKRHPTAEAEKERYLNHENSESNEGYVQFLEKLLKPLLELKPKSDAKILDYGCGPKPVLSELMQHHDFKVENYDPNFFPKDLAATTWDIIISTEVWEHFRDPKTEIEKQLQILKPEGILAVMTQLHQGPENFFEWWYVRDFTHVSFYSAKTLKWVADQYQLEFLYQKNPAVIFKKK